MLLDVFTRAIRGWELAADLTEALPLAALDQALTRHCPEFHHSDQGVQSAARSYVARLAAAGVQVSMSEVGKPTQNAFAERFMRTLKEEEVALYDYQDLAEARARIGHFIDDVYLTKRVHSALGYLTPAEFEKSHRRMAQPPSRDLPLRGPRRDMRITAGSQVSGDIRAEKEGDQA